MAKKNELAPADGFEKVENAMNNAEGFVESHQKELLIGFVAVIAVVALYFLLSLKVWQPREENAKSEIVKAEQMFAIDSFQVALDGKEDEFLGFLDIIDEYGSTSTGNLAKAYAGICYKNLEQYDEAIKYLNKFSGDDVLVSPAIVGAVADCYWDMKEESKAVSSYLKAAELANNDLLTPLYKKRAAMCQISLGKNAEAIKLLESILKDYPYSMELPEVQKYLGIAKNAK